ncbi:hypothetical protein EMIHUDRAFT_240500 [Emiliania huxleyi CCMP1516]|uniref:cellulose 1,4-beta-cellobiosidase (non-reducing end) n=3 Tax=Emiliania huxleyi TaxID=2903 RepID=A0A0D3JEZ5_EMIH1|nr:hypothetical protein EMIHUDRAFT_240500 [Emiliania huxleyi CCMP1516]EOD22080.1 hypothetical protein EMIHUDRAFT_240500 [Emiliania huxleyi CCMP1516]|eukprot:XP_005774509.1 hypothetical protein EMIHUDRAFT_240500 [Emiliania huxleyi CCMP1516]
MSRFLLAPTLAVGAWSPTLTAWSLPIGGSSGAGGFVGEAWGKVGNVQALRERLTVRGNNRLYAVAEIPSKERPKWSDFSYLRLPLLNRRLAFEVDLSAVGCGCNAAVYLVAMPPRPGADASMYCDIQGYDAEPCLEIDLLEANTKAVQAALHTTVGRGGRAGSCNQDGCVANAGNTAASAGLYGLHAPRIDTARPFTVSATFDEGGAFDVTLVQQQASLLFFDPAAVNGSASPDGFPAPVPATDRARTRAALSGGMTLVVSLWSADDLSWLDGGCDAAHPRRAVETAETFEEEGGGEEELEADAPAPPNALQSWTI